MRGNVTRRTRGNQKTGTQEVLDLTWNADHQLVESNTTRHGVTQATRYAYDPTGRCVAKSDAFCSTHYLWDRDLMVHSRLTQDRRCTSMSREALCHWPPFRERARTQPLLVPMRPDWRATRVDRRTRPRGLGRTTAYSWSTGRGISLWD